MNERKKVVKIPLVPLIAIILVIAILVTTFWGTKIITNAAKYTATNAATSVDGKYDYEELEDGTIKITAYNGTEREVTIPATIDGKMVTCISADTFQFCNTIRSIKISNGITNLEYSAFYACMNVKKIEIPESVTYIDSDAFYGCINLEEILVAENNINFMSEDGILFNKEKTQILRYPAGRRDTKYVIPKGIKTIGYSAFDDSMYLYSIQIPDGVTTIEDYAFYSCTSLRSIEVPESVMEIGYDAFAFCTNLTNIEIPKNVQIEHDTLEERILEDSRIIKVVNAESTLIQEVELPDIIKRSMDENDILYNEDGIELTNCTLSEDKTKLLVDTATLGEQNASLLITSGTLKYLKLEIMPSGTITYSESTWPEWCPFKTDVIAILNLEYGETITNNNGKNAFIFSNNGEFTFEYKDKSGNIKRAKARVDSIMDFSLEVCYITEVQPKTTVEQLTASLLKTAEGDTINIKIYNAQKEEIKGDALVGTGMQVDTIWKEEEITSYILVVKGDADGDGDIGISDLAKINAHRLKKKTLEEANLMAADVDDNGTIDLTDLSKVNRFRLHKSTQL